MRQTGARKPYVGSASVPRTCFPNARGVLFSRHGLARAVRSPCHRLGFTLIEVVIAMSILVVVVLALLSSYTFYYRSITNLRIQSIGENLAQLQLEDIRNAGMGSLHDILGGKWTATMSPAGPWPLPVQLPETYKDPNYPAAELFYVTNEADPIWYPYMRQVPASPIGPGNRPLYDVNGNLQWPSVATPLPAAPSTKLSLEKILASITYDSTSGEPLTYDSGVRESTFVMEGLTSGPSSDLTLPESIVVEGPSSGLYTLNIE